MTSSSPDLLPRVLIVSRRTVRKNKFVDFVGEYHLDLLVGYGAVPVIVPRVSGVHAMIDAFEPIHGVLLCEGEDIDPSLYAAGAGDEDEDGGLSAEQMEAVRRRHPSDAAMADHEKDSIELLLARRCLDKGIPFLGICRGSQVLNVASGGSLYRDLELELGGHAAVVRHIDYGDYDAHRHPVRVLPGTPLRDWFAVEDETIMVNSYHHQGVRRLAPRFAPMAFAPDGLVEAFYDPAEYSPGEGKFAVGLQFHPERMRKQCASAGAGEEDEFDYPGCPVPYREFVRAAAACQAKQQLKLKLKPMPMPMPARALDAPVRAQAKPEKQQRKVILRSLSLAKNLCFVFGRGGDNGGARTEEEHDAGAEFLESESTAAALSAQQEKRLKQMGATVRNASGYMDMVKAQQSEEREGAARALMAKMSASQLSSLAAFYRAMGSICAEVLDAKLAASS